MIGPGAEAGGPTPALDAAERLREIAFAAILTEVRGVTIAELEALAGGQPAPMVEVLSSRGRIDRDEDGRVSGSAGLSLTEGPHRLRIGGRDYRTWCAYDAIGIPAALGVTAHIETACGICQRRIELAMVDGRPTRNGPEVLWLAAESEDLRAEFCTPTVILCGREHAAEWAARQANRGALVGLEDAADRGAVAWARCAAAARRLGTVEYVDGPRDGTTEERLSLPEELPGLGGRYARSVRCADDGAMRYVWRPAEGEQVQVDTKGDTTWPIGS